MSEIKIENPYPRLMVLDYYSPQEVVQFRQEHILWLLKHIQDLKRDCYPLGVKTNITSPALLYISLTECLKKCGLDGLILLARESLDMLEGDLGGFFNQSAKEIIKMAQTALLYVSYELQHKDADPITYQEFKHLVELGRPGK